MITVHLKKAMIPSISLLELLRPTDMTFSTWVVSVSANVTTDLALYWVITWATVYVDLEAHLGT